MKRSTLVLLIAIGVLVALIIASAVYFRLTAGFPAPALGV